jgi:branched-chain amino acid transport system substrate-binding protein
MEDEMMKWMLAFLLMGMLLLAGCPQEEEPQGEPEEEQGTPLPYVEEPEPEPKTIRVGFVGPLTGEHAPEGIEALNSLSLAASELSDNLYVYEVIEQDGKCTSEGAAEALEYLVDYRGVDIVIGGVCPEEVEGMAPLLEDGGPLLLSLAEGGGGTPQVMSFFGSSGSIGEAIARFCYENDLRRTMVVTDGTNESDARKGAFDSAAKALGLSTQPAQQYGQDFESKVSIIKGYQPEVIVIFSSDAAVGAYIVNVFRAYGVNSAIVGDHTLVSPYAISQMGENSEGVYAVTPEFEYSEPLAEYFLRQYEYAYGPAADASLVGDARNALYLFAQAEDFYSHSATSQDLRNYWMNLESWEGMGGTLYFVDGDRVSSYRQLVVAGGSVEELP